MQRKKNICACGAVTSLADSCTTLRVKALLQSMTFGSRVDDLRFNALRAVQCGYAAFKCDVVAVTSLADSCTTLRVKALLQSMTCGSKVLSPLRYESGKAERNALRAVQS